MPVILMTVDAVGGVWSYASDLCAALPEFRFVLASLGPRPSAAQREAVVGLGNTELVESDFRLEWMAGGQDDLAASRRWLEELAAHHAADVIHVNGYAQARLCSAAPVIAVAHSDVASWWMAVHGCLPPPEWHGYRGEVSLGLRAADRVVALTAAVADDLRCHYGYTAAQIVPNGVNLAAYQPEPKQPVIMAAGRVWDEAKNLRLLDAIAPYLPWPIEIAGEKRHPESNTVAIAHARALGVLPAAQLRARLSRAAIFAAPARYEPFGLSILEAAASGCALVLGDVASLREIWEGAAVFLPPNDPQAWREALSLLTADHVARDRYGAEAHQRAQDFALTRTAAAYRALYGAVIAEHRARQAA